MALIRSLFGGLVRRAISSSNIGTAYGLAGEAAEMGFDLALSMCGNPGQVSVIEQTGFDAFYEGARDVLEGGDSSGAIYAACPYPDAVGEILDAAAEEINGFMEEALGGAFGTGAQIVDEYW